VTDVERAVGFWTGLIGLAALGGQDGARAVGSDGRPVIVLRETASRPATAGYAGLYHVAVHFASEFEFARALARLADAGWPVSPVDHVFSRAIYLYDPDRIGVELALETPWRVREVGADPVRGLYSVDHDGQIHGPGEPLDVAALLAVVDRDGPSVVAEGAYVGHIHLSVPDLRAAVAFYRDQLGMIEHINAPQFGVADLYAGGVFKHRIALNTFRGPGTPPNPTDMAGMDRYTIRFDTVSQLERVIARVRQMQTPVQERDAGAHVEAPGGVTIDLTSATDTR
jgi:catechol 2,3-dioxygenase